MMNIGEAKETRDKQTAKRCLRLLLTDGQQSVKAFEYRMLPDLRIETPVGTKVSRSGVSDASSCSRL